MTKEVPRFKHDCASCTFIGYYDEPGESKCDLYAHWSGDQKTVVIRWGDAPDLDCASGLDRAKDFKGLQEAVRRGVDKGIIPPEVKHPLCIRKKWNLFTDRVVDLFDLWEKEIALICASVEVIDSTVLSRIEDRVEEVWVQARDDEWVRGEIPPFSLQQGGWDKASDSVTIVWGDASMGMR